MSTAQTITSLALQAERALSASGFDLTTYLKEVDLGAVGLLAILGVLVYFAIEGLIAVIPSYYADSTYYEPSSYLSYGRSLLSASAKAWPEIRKELASEDTRGGRSLEVLTPVLDALQAAYLRWEESDVNEVKAE
ncbi:uncharacterized protein LOC143041381 [Oratosquilla oratoria]|uniref:uncharacterized protein LOC143041381 n=1 Tax=Oratosquilla oratoria TaxID=337810 RepID=UPI003F76E0FE